MKKFLIAPALTALLFGSALAADQPSNSMDVLTKGKQVCLRTDHVLGRIITDDHTIYFRMSDGSVWKNTLQSDCVGLRITDRFDLVKQRDHWMCSNEQRIRVPAGAGGYCFLGDFARSALPGKDASGN